MIDHIAGQLHAHLTGIEDRRQLGDFQNIGAVLTHNLCELNRFACSGSFCSLVVPFFSVLGALLVQRTLVASCTSLFTVIEEVDQVEFFRGGLHQ